MNKTFEEIMNFRHACKLFDETKKIPQKDLEFILDMGCKSPSSFGMEHWKFLVIQNQELKERIRPFAWNQPQITTCSDLVIILAKVDDIKPNNSYVSNMFSRRDMPKEKFDMYLEIYANHLKETMSNSTNILAWSARQCYIALANLMNSAASIGIDTCPIEGFEKENIENLLNIDTSKYQLAVMLPLGYRVNPQSTQLRLDSKQTIEYIK